jgi:MFS family permease
MKPNSSKLPAIPSGIWILGFVSMLMDISSEMIHAIFPIYLVTVFGTSMLTVGFIEGIAEATAAITKLFSGALSDWLGKRKLLAALGYGLAAFTKPIFPLATSVGWLVTARVVDRIGKGIRGAPRDALVADIAPVELRGASFGLRQSLDTIGALLGPLIAITLLWIYTLQFQLVFWVAILPAFLSFGLIVLAVKEPTPAVGNRRVKSPLSRLEIARLGSMFWLVVAIATVFTLARFSEAFLILRAQATGLPIYLIPTVLVVMNATYALSAYPAGVLSDYVDRPTILITGLAVLISADILLAFSDSLVGVAAGVGLWGLHMGLTQGLLSTLIADAAPPELRGTAFGIFNLLTGIATLFASVVAGEFWDMGSYRLTFVAGAVFAGVAIIGLIFTRRCLRPKAA